MNKSDLKCIRKPTRSRLSLTHLPIQPLSMSKIVRWSETVIDLYLDLDVDSARIHVHTLTPFLSVEAAASASFQVSPILRGSLLTTLLHFILGLPSRLFKSGPSHPRKVFAVLCVGGPSVSDDRTNDLQSFWTSDMEWTARRRCFGAGIFKFPAPT